ncbi:MAG TPA: radical SAM family heme chaperone HemW [Gemmatimonadales bacterium]|nr:radical SAM family heme chaperone HemW [Gemmatimonadales bacterium]
MRHVYIHVPFCRRRCTYCDFSIAVRKTIPAREFVAAVQTEHGMRRAAGEWDDEPLATLYLGGGTPSLLPAQALAALLHGFLSPLPRAEFSEREITLEANPEDVTADAAEAWVRAGVTRVSLGVQSLNPTVLAWMHRSHAGETAAHAVSLLRRAGIRSLSVDLIFALPADLGVEFGPALQAALALEPDHLSVYGLTREPRTAYARMLERGAARAAADQRYEEEFLSAHQRLTAEGYQHYEVSNYARPGHESRHNRAYWTGAPYAGLGPSAHRFLRGRRSWNVAPWAWYQRRVSAGQDPTEGTEVLNAEQQALEEAYLSLRTAQGSAPVGRLAPAALQQAVSLGWLQADGGRVSATPLGWLRLDELVSVLTTLREGG